MQAKEADPNNEWVNNEIRRLVGEASNGPSLELANGKFSTFYTAKETVIVGSVYEASGGKLSNPEALRQAEGQGHFEIGDLIAFAQGLVNGPASWVNEKVFDENPHYAGAAVVGKELSKNLVMEAATAGIGKLLDLARPAEAVSETALSEVEAISVRNSKPGGTGSVGAAALDDPVFGSENLSYGDTKATLKAIRRHSERLVSGDVISNDSVVRDLTANVQGTFAAGDRTRAGSALHELNFEGSRLAERLIKSDELP